MCFTFILCSDGVVISLSLSLSLSHSDLRRVPELRRMERRHAKKHHFVTMEWVRDSIECEFMKNERLYEPNV